MLNIFRKKDKIMSDKEKKTIELMATNVEDVKELKNTLSKAAYAYAVEYKLSGKKRYC